MFSNFNLSLLDFVIASKSVKSAIAWNIFDIVIRFINYNGCIQVT
jgi:hypothetical protein